MLAVSADRAFDALADPIRREILGVLADGEELRAGDIALQIDRVGRTAVSTHLRILRTAELIRERRDGRNRFYAIDPDGAARDVIELLGALLGESLQPTADAAENSGDKQRDVM